MHPSSQMHQRTSSQRGAICTSSTSQPNCVGLQKRVYATLPRSSAATSNVLHSRHGGAEGWQVHHAGRGKPTFAGCMQSIADVSCIGPIRSAGVKLVRVRLTSVSDKHAAFRASAALRREKVYLDDDLTRAQQATRRRLEPARQRYMSQGMPAWWRGDTLLFRQHGEVHKHDDARRSDQHASQHQSSSPMHASPRHPPAAAVPTVGAARRSDAGGPVNQAPPSGAIAATSPPPGPTLPPPPPNPPVASSSMATHVPRPSYAHATSASPPSGPPSRQRRRPNRA